MNKDKDMLEIKKMLEALLKSESLVAWIGGWVGGRTSNDDPFIVLYPAADWLKEKACRVYEHDFDKLPAFIPTGQVPADTEANPSKGQAQRAGIYHECPRFKVVMYLGKETPLGKEKRFGDVLYVPAQQNGSGPVERSSSQPSVNPQGSDGDEDARAHWRVQAATAGDPFMFDTALVKLEPWYKDSDNVRDFRQALFGEWDDSHTEAYVLALEAYAARRRALNGSRSAREAHRQAKQHALSVLREKVKQR